MSLAEDASQSLAVLSVARRQDLSTVRAKHRAVNPILMGKGGDKLARRCIPELGGVIRACRQDPSTVRAEGRVVDPILMGKGGDGRRQRLFAMSD